MSFRQTKPRRALFATPLTSMSTMRTTDTETRHGAHEIDRRAAAHEIAAKTGYDWRTALKALESGVEAIRPLKMRETLRPIVAEYLDRLAIKAESARG